MRTGGRVALKQTCFEPCGCWISSGMDSKGAFRLRVGWVCACAVLALAAPAADSGPAEIPGAMRPAGR